MSEPVPWESNKDKLPKPFIGSGSPIVGADESGERGSNDPEGQLVGAGPEKPGQINVEAGMNAVDAASQSSSGSEPNDRLNAASNAESAAGLSGVEKIGDRMPLLSELIAAESRKNAMASTPKSIGDRWEVQNRLGAGGMSTVYKARHLLMNKVCAVKILNANLTAKSESLQRFQREAKAASSLNHPNVINVLDCGVTPEQHAFLIMDYLEGESLGDLIRRDGKLPPERALPIFLQTCDALAHAHERSVIHRDLKPSNLMLIEAEGKKDFVKIVDFGIAKLLDINLSPDDETHQRLTHTGDVFGSPLYMSPEQCSGQESDRRSDIYSMGCLMYETLSGVPPFVGANTLDTIRLKLGDDAAPIIDGKGDRLLKRLNAVVQKCLEKDPDDRYHSMDSLKKDLILARDESEAVWHSRALATRKKMRWSSWLRMTPKKVVLLVVSAIVLSVGTTIYIDSLGSGLPSAYEHQSLWSTQRYEVKDDAGTEVLKPTTAGPPGSIGNRPAAEAVIKRLMNKFAEADAFRQEEKFLQASTAYTWAIKRWNSNEAQDLPDASWTGSTSKAYYGLGLCKAKLGKYQEANDCYQQAIDYGQKDHSMPPALFKDMQKMYERNQWKVNPVKAIMRVLSNKEMLPPGAS